MNQFTELTVPVTQISHNVKYSTIFLYRDTLFCHLSEGANFKNVEVVFSYHLPVCKSASLHVPRAFKVIYSFPMLPHLWLKKKITMMTEWPLDIH